MDSSSYRIAPAASRHIPLLAGIERAAAEAFPGHLLPPEIRDGAIAPEKLERARRGDRLWVAVDEAGEPVGFLLAEEKGGTGFIVEVDVHPEHQGRGIGRRLIAAALDWARESGYPSLTLTTFASLPWNAPFYERIGFRRIAQEELSTSLSHQIAEEKKLGMRERVAMRYTIERKKHA